MTDRLEDMAEHIVTDGVRQMEFVGVLIGSSSSHQPGKPRWAEVYIYRTESGKYIVAGIGRTKLEGERDKCWANVYDDPGLVIERLYMNDTERGRYLPYSSREALDMAHATDTSFPTYMTVEHIA